MRSSALPMDKSEVVAACSTLIEHFLKTSILCSSLHLTVPPDVLPIDEAVGDSSLPSHLLQNFLNITPTGNLIQLDDLAGYLMPFQKTLGHVAVRAMTL